MRSPLAPKGSEVAEAEACEAGVGKEHAEEEEGESRDSSSVSEEGSDPRDEWGGGEGGVEGGVEGAVA